MYEGLAVHQVNKFLWNELKATAVMTDQYGGMVPIIPGQQQPEFINLHKTKPHIVYQYWPERLQRWPIKHETIRYDIYSADDTAARKIFHAMLDLFDRPDDVPDEMNAYIASSPFNILTTEVTSAQSPEPADQEGGRSRTRLFIKVGYTQKITPSTYGLTGKERNMTR